MKDIKMISSKVDNQNVISIIMDGEKSDIFAEFFAISMSMKLNFSQTEVENVFQNAMKASSFEKIDENMGGIS